METTIHGENIAGQICDEDAYGYSGTLNVADIREIVDQIHTNLLDGGQESSPLMRMIERWLGEAESATYAAEEAATT